MDLSIESNGWGFEHNFLFAYSFTFFPRIFHLIFFLFSSSFSFISELCHGIWRNIFYENLIRLIEIESGFFILIYKNVSGVSSSFSLSNFFLLLSVRLSYGLASPLLLSIYQISLIRIWKLISMEIDSAIQLKDLKVFNIFLHLNNFISFGSR